MGRHGRRGLGDFLYFVQSDSELSHHNRFDPIQIDVQFQSSYS